MPTAKRDSRFWYFHFRQVTTRHSFKLLWLWAGLMLFGLGNLHYKTWRGENVGYKRDDLMPDVEISYKMGRLIKDLGLDKTIQKDKLLIDDPATDVFFREH